MRKNFQSGLRQGLNLKISGQQNRTNLQSKDPAPKVRYGPITKRVKTNDIKLGTSNISQPNPIPASIDLVRRLDPGWDPFTFPIQTASLSARDQRGPGYAKLSSLGRCTLHRSGTM